MKIKELIIYGKNKLNEKNVNDSGIIAKSLAKYLLKMDDTKIVVNSENEVEEEVKEEYIKLIEKILSGKPLQYITNKQEFMGIEFYVDEKVLIPQPDTEILVEEVLKIYEKNLNNKEENNNIKILDICTGSGAIAISISKILKNVDITASDISKDALEIAKKNAINNNVEIEFIKSNMFENINNKYNIIVSNPPYIKTDIIKTLDRQVQNEPLIALDGGEDGLEFYRILVKESKKYLKENGFICMEIGFDQKEEVEKLLIDNNYSNIYCKKDLSENDRIVVANI